MYSIHDPISYNNLPIAMIQLHSIYNITPYKDTVHIRSHYINLVIKNEYLFLKHQIILHLHLLHRYH